MHFERTKSVCATNEYTQVPTSQHDCCVVMYYISHHMELNLCLQVAYLLKHLTFVLNRLIMIEVQGKMNLPTSCPTIDPSDP